MKIKNMYDFHLQYLKSLRETDWTIVNMDDWRVVETVDDDQKGGGGEVVSASLPPQIDRDD